MARPCLAGKRIGGSNPPSSTNAHALAVAVAADAWVNSLNTDALVQVQPGAPSASDPPRPCEATVTSTARTTPPYLMCSRHGGASSSVTARAGGWAFARHVDGA